MMKTQICPTCHIQGRAAEQMYCFHKNKPVACRPIGHGDNIVSKGRHGRQAKAQVRTRPIESIVSALVAEALGV